MAEEWVSASASAWVSGGGVDCWRVVALRPDGQGHVHVFPKAALEWRIAEYELGGVEEALDMVLHEPFATDPMDQFTARDDAAVRVGMVTRLPGPKIDYEGTRLHNAATIADAREAHRTRIKDAKTRVRVVPPKGNTDPLDVIRSQHGVTDAGVREKRQLVVAARRAWRGEASSSPTSSIIFDDTHAEDRRA